MDKRRPVLILIVIVAVPLALLAWVGIRLSRHERTVLKQQLRNLLTDRLLDIDGEIRTHFERLELDLQQLTSVSDYEPDHLRELCRAHPRVFQLFVIDPDGRLLHPDPLGSLNRNEREFITRASQIITDRELQRAAQAQLESPQSIQRAMATAARESAGNVPILATKRSGWFVWYWGRGLNLIFWQVHATGHIVGAALDRSRWIADLIAVLPDTPPDVADDQFAESLSRIRLIDSTSQVVYQWGQFEPPPDATPNCEIQLSAPMAAWRLQQLLPAGRLDAGSPSSTLFSVGTTLMVAAIGLVMLAVYFYREYARDIRESGKRVSFVNQVSHELRTPLTNIRMYADLLDSDLDKVPDDDVGKARERLKVIQLEGQRLNRLIGNVLTFARQQRKSLRLDRSPCRVDEIVKDVLERFQPSLKQHGIVVRFSADASTMVLADSDVIEQILGNLISNVEKYASEGKHLDIATGHENGNTTITIADRGPGIAMASREAIFQPFWRESDSVRGASGTGIGLTIARELARLHGGDLQLLEADQGAVFQAVLATPTVGQERA